MAILLDQIQMNNELNKATNILESGGVILYPTDTIWGLGCLATDELAIRRIYDIKCRPVDKQMICLVDGLRMISKYVNQPFSRTEQMMKRIPQDKPTSIIFKRIKNLPKILTSELNTVAFRITSDAFSKQLVSSVKEPILATSANISGQSSPLQFKDISHKILEDVDYVVNLHRNRKDISPSRVVSFTEEGLVILRG